MTSSWLQTDGYKFSMAQAGWPLRRETFVYVHRKGGWQFLPFDPVEEVSKLLPEAPTSDDPWLTWLAGHGYDLGAASRAALADPQIAVHGLPKFSWFYQREPVFTVTGRSLPVSWLEPLVLRLHYRIQVATAAILRPQELLEKCECVATEGERALVLETLEVVRRHFPDVPVPKPALRVSPDLYFDAVSSRMTALVDAVGGNPDRIFEVGMRAAVTEGQHSLALTACAEAGVTRTSNVMMAKALGLTPVGTMGHEHVQRFGGDLPAYRAMRDRVPGFVFMLPDTFNTLRSGLPAALTVLKETPGREMGIRFDSEAGIRWHYLAAVARMKEVGTECRIALEGGWDLAKTAEFEGLREQVGLAPENQCYGYGNFVVKPPWPHFGRDDVSAVWKLSQTADMAVQKFGDEPGGAKESPPGEPVTWRPPVGSSGYAGPVGVIAQSKEDLNHRPVVDPRMFHPSDIPRLAKMASKFPSVMSLATAALRTSCCTRRASILAEGAALDERL